MLYTKKIEEITYQDVVNFCVEQIRENISLDYKESIDGSLAKTIAAMANTWGGLIIIGVEDEDSKPKLPIKGIEFKEYLPERINNIVLGNITPPIFPEIQVCSSDGNKSALIVIRVPQSNITPHAIRANTKVYLRTNTSNEPEELASVNRILWLVNKRAKSIDLRNSFFKKAELRLQKLTNKKVPIQYADTIFSSSPLYPFEAMVNYRKLIDSVLSEISVKDFGESFPVNLYYGGFNPVQNGSYSLIFNKENRFISYEELNHFGFFYHRENMAHLENKNGQMRNICYPLYILIRLNLFIQSIIKLYSILGYWGYIKIKLALNNIGQVTFTDLPAPRGKYKIDHLLKKPIDNQLVFSKEVMFKDLKENGPELVISLFTELAWAIGFSHINEKVIKELFEKGW